MHYIVKSGERHIEVKASFVAEPVSARNLCPGRCIARLKNAQNPERLLFILEDLHVMQNYRGKGHARAMLQALQEEVKAKGATLSVSIQGRGHLMNFFGQMGFYQPLPRSEVMYWPTPVFLVEPCRLDQLRRQADAPLVDRLYEALDNGAYEMPSKDDLIKALHDAGIALYDMKRGE